jgi:threonine dehydrogenase-like Zn-dependent dehydrogenase
MVSRRRFLGTSAAALAWSRLSGYAAELAEARKRVGLIGSGWYGKCDLFRLIQVAPVEVVSLCDVDKRMLADAAEQVAARQASRKTPRTYTDYREMLREKDLDVVLIATPDHWHALPMIAAVEAGADVYVQKPTGVDVVESQAMVAAARKHGRVVQVGTPATPSSRRAAWARSPSWTFTATTTCARARILPTPLPPTTSTTRCGRGRRR